MKLKTLYSSAKTSKSTKDINAYNEAVNVLLESKPSEYIQNVEYIIRSSSGLSTFEPFIERYGLSLMDYDSISLCLEDAIHKCEVYNNSAKPFELTLDIINDMKSKYSHIISFFEVYSDKLDDTYKKYYYERTTPLLNNIDRLYSRYGMAVLPDIMIECVKNNTINKLIKILESGNLDASAYQWIYESLKNTNKLDSIYPLTLEKQVNDISDRDRRLFRESVLGGNIEPELEYTEKEVQSIMELIAIKEQLMTSVTDDAESIKIYNELCSLYEAYGELGEMVGDSVIPMLPNNMIKTESPNLQNTSNKKTGKPADYIKRNHNMATYGEEEDDDDKFKRPSVRSEEDSNEDKESETDNVSEKDREEEEEDRPTEGELKQSIKDADTPEEKKAAINNYYYYTYTNSFNKNKSMGDNSTDNSRNNDTVHHHKESYELDFGKYEYTSEGFLDKAEDSSNYLSEDWKDTLKSVGTKVVKGIKQISNRFFTKKTLGNLQMMDVPKNLFKILPLMTIGGMPLSSQGIQESTDLFTEDWSSLKTNLKRKMGIRGNNIQDTTERDNEYNKTMEINLSELRKSELSEKEIREVCIKLSKRINTPVLISNLTKFSQYGSSLAIRVTKDEYEHLKDNPAYLPTLRDDSGGHRDIGVIILSPLLFTLFPIKSKHDVEIVFMHEYGHILSYDKITEEDWIYQRVVENNLSVIMGLMGLSGQSESHAVFSKAYYQNKPEKLANQYGGVKEDELVKVISGTSLPSNYQSSPLWKFTQIKISPASLKVFTDVNVYGRKANPRDQLADLDWTVQIYQQLFPNKEVSEMFPLYQTLRTRLQGEITGLNESRSSDYLANFADIFIEEVEDVDHLKPESDHPIRDTLTEVDKRLGRVHQAAKNTVRNTIHAGKVFVKPFKRAHDWLNNMVAQWKDKSENEIKERMADPHARSSLWRSIKTAIVGGSLFRANILLGSVFIYLRLTRGLGGPKEARIRNETISELKAELDVVDEKIRDADKAQDNKAKYQLIRFKNELNKKLIRVGGTKRVRKMI
jgi:hypothetical protein